MSRLVRVKRGLGVVGVLMYLLVLPEMVGAGAHAGLVLLSLAASAVNVIIVLLTSAGKVRHPGMLVPVTAALAVATGSALSDPIVVVQACVGLTIGQSMFGSLRSVALRVASLMPVASLCAVLSSSPIGQQTPWNSQAVLSALPAVPVFAVFIVLLRQGLESQAVTIARETFMAKLSSSLLSAGSIQEIAPVMVQANADLRWLSPDVITLELQRIGPDEKGPEGGARLLNSHGDLGKQLPQIIPAQALTELPPFGQDGSRPLHSGSTSLNRLGLPPRRWHAIALKRDPGAPCDLVLHGVRNTISSKRLGISLDEEEFLTITRLMTRHWQAAMLRVQLRAALVEAQELDDITSMPDRSATRRAITDLLRRNDSRRHGVVVQLSGLDRIEAAHGLAAADLAMNQMAHRITRTTAEHARVSRAGDASFALVLNDSSGPQLPTTVLEALENALREPVLLPSGPAKLTPTVSAIRSGESLRFAVPNAT